MSIPHILLINPWIHDFAAYDVWAKPLGILTLAGILRKHGLKISYIDCLNRFHASAPTSNPYARHGRGPYHKTRISKPKGLKDIPRNYCRYGIEPEWFKKDLQALIKPDLICITSLMTYWYPGVQETICVIREIFPDVPIVLGGIYASLCEDHARQYSGADEVITGDGSSQIFDIIQKYTGYLPPRRFDPSNLNTYPYPGFDLQKTINYVPVLTSRGCPFNCAYCASYFLDKERKIREPKQVVDEIRFWHEKYKVKDFVFYDDALLLNSKKHAIPMLEGIIKLGLNLSFHTPNAVHIREITPQIAHLMFKAGFKTLRLGLETTAFEKRGSIDHKVTESEFINGAKNLKNAGFTPQNVGAYLLAGLPHQSIEAIEASIKTVKSTNIMPILAYYTPIPHTQLWPDAVAVSRYDIEADPVFTNNAVFPCWPLGFSWEVVSRLKKLVRR